MFFDFLWEPKIVHGGRVGELVSTILLLVVLCSFICSSAFASPCNTCDVIASSIPQSQTVTRVKEIRRGHERPFDTMKIVEK